MENITGPAVIAGNYLATRRFLVDDLRKMVSRYSVVIEAPRRFGKTSVVKEFVRQEVEKGENSDFLVLFLELEGESTLDQFCFKLYRALIGIYVLRRCGVWLKELIQEGWNMLASRVTSIGLPEFELELREKTRDSDFTTWKERIEPLFAGLTKLGKDVVIIFDEFPDMLLNFANNTEPLGFEKATDVLTAWLRSVRQQQSTSHCRFVFCGSVNLRKTLEEAGLSKRMNDTETLRVPPMAQEEAAVLLKSLSNNYGILLESSALDFMIGKTADGPPYYGQVFIKALRDTRQTEITLELLQGIYNNLLHNGDHDLNHFDSRLNDYIPSKLELSCSRTVLRTLCTEAWSEKELYDFAIANTGLEFASYHKIVDRLVYEGYLKRDIKDSGKLSFLSPLLRDWWACKEGVR